MEDRKIVLGQEVSVFNVKFYDNKLNYEIIKEDNLYNIYSKCGDNIKEMLNYLKYLDKNDSLENIIFFVNEKLLDVEHFIKNMTQHNEGGNTNSVLNQLLGHNQQLLKSIKMIFDREEEKYQYFFSTEKEVIHLGDNSNQETTNLIHQKMSNKEFNSLEEIEDFIDSRGRSNSYKKSLVSQLLNLSEY